MQRIVGDTGKQPAYEYDRQVSNVSGKDSPAEGTTSTPSTGSGCQRFFNLPAAPSIADVFPFGKGTVGICGVTEEMPWPAGMLASVSNLKEELTLC